MAPSSYPQEETFEQWVTNRFGKRLFQTFLKNLHREGLGHSLLGAESGMGRAADQGSLAEDGRAQHVREAEEDNQDIDRSI